MNKRCFKGGFTLTELLVVVLIIGVLASVAVPQYQKAVAKSRFSALMMPVKALHDAQENFFLTNGVYSSSLDMLDVTDEDDVNASLSDTEGYTYVLASMNSPKNNYVAYQTHSENFAGDTHCEALTEDSLANEVCKSFQGEEIGTRGNYTVYRLTGNGAGIFKNLRKIISESCSGTTCTYVFEEGGQMRVNTNAVLGADVCTKYANSIECATSMSQTEYGGTRGVSIELYDENMNRNLTITSNPSQTGRIRIWDNGVNVAGLEFSFVRGQISVITSVLSNGSTPVRYYGNGNVMREWVNGTYYYYNEDGTPFTSSSPAHSVNPPLDLSKYSQYLSLSNDNICKLAPEYEGC